MLLAFVGLGDRLAALLICEEDASGAPEGAPGLGARDILGG